LLSALLVALREGVEAALVVGIVLVYLDRTGRASLARFVWAGVGLATAASVAVALLLQRWKVSQDGFEGLLLLLAAVFVVTMVIWMNRVARHLKKEIEQRVEAFAQKASLSAGLGLGLFVFLMVLREGVELVVILRAVEISSEGLSTWIGTFVGLAVAIAVGAFFFKGTLRIPLARFFSATSTILIFVAIQLGITGLHELSEAQWLPSSQREMAIIGPMVSNEVFFFVLILGVAAIVVLREWLGLRHQALPAEGLNDAERRRLEWDRRRQRRWAFAAAFTCVAVVLALAAEFVYARTQADERPQARALVPEGGFVRIPIAEVSDSNLHFYSVTMDDKTVRFIVIKKPGGWGTALDACLICGPQGYRQEGSNVICRNCGAAIYIPSIGESGGCNPVGVHSRVEGGSIVIELAALSQATSQVPAR
jgi:high-affinity iron transporter